jgi:hypothetical protein
MHCGSTRDIFDRGIERLAPKFHCLSLFITSSMMLHKPLDLLDKLDIFERWHKRGSPNLIFSR